MARESVRERAEAHARDAGETDVTIRTVEEAIADGRRTMKQVMRAGGHEPRQQQGE